MGIWDDDGDDELPRYEDYDTPLYDESFIDDYVENDRDGDWADEDTVGSAPGGRDIDWNPPWRSEVRGVASRVEPTEQRSAGADGTHRVAYDFWVAGISYEGRQQVARAVGCGTSVRLEREPRNPHDPNAILVVAPSGALGYVPRALAASMASVLDAGASAAATVKSVARPRAGKPYYGVEIRATLGDRRGAAPAATDAASVSSTRTSLPPSSSSQPAAESRSEEGSTAAEAPASASGSDDLSSVVGGAIVGGIVGSIFPGLGTCAGVIIGGAVGMWLTQQKAAK